MVAFWPCQPGRREEAKSIFEEIRETRQSEYEASRSEAGEEVFEAKVG